MNSVSRTAKRPNVLFTDDQRSGTLSALGNSETYTPNLGKLVRQGTTLAVPSDWSITEANVVGFGQYKTAIAPSDWSEQADSQPSGSGSRTDLRADDTIPPWASC